MIRRTPFWLNSIKLLDINY